MRQYILVILMTVCTAVSAQNDRQLIREGNRLYRQKQYAQAEVLYRKAIAKNAENPQAQYNLGCALMMQQKDSAAVIQYQNAAKLEKNKLRQSKSWHNVGVMCQSHQMYGEAIKAYEQALRCNPTDDETRYNLALCKQMNKNNPQQNQNQQDKKNEDQQDDKGQQQKKDKKDKQKEEKPQEQMSKENAERLLDAAVQNEKATQQRLQKAMQQPRKKQLQKNW